MEFKKYKSAHQVSIFNACVKSAFLYGCETCLVTASITSCIRLFVNSWSRHILGTIPNQQIFRETKQITIDREIMNEKYGWIEHNLRKSNSEIADEVLEWNS